MVAVLTGSSSVLAQSHEQGEQNFEAELPILEMCEPSTTRTERRTVKAVARPPYLKGFKEPGFGTRTIRVTDSVAGEVSKPAGHSVSAWNSDESLIMLHRYVNDTRELLFLDGSSYEDLGVLDNPTHSAEQVYWSHSDPDLVYFVADEGENAGKLLEYNVRNADENELTDFTALCSKQGLSSAGGILARPSVDDDLFVYRCSAKSGNSLLISYRQSNGSVATQSLGKHKSWPVDSLPEPAYSGNYLWHQGAILDDVFKPVGKALDMKEPAKSVALGINSAGDDVVFQSTAQASPDGCSKDVWKGLGMLIQHEVPEGSCSSVLNQTDSYPLLSEPEISLSAYQRPYWLAMSNMGYADFGSFTSKTSAPQMFSEIFIANTQNDEPEVCRLAHHRSYGEKAKNASYSAHLGMPNVTQSPSGTRVIFSSDWYDSGYVDSYVLELPAYTRHKLEGKWVDLSSANMVTEFHQVGRSFSFKRRYIDPESPEEKPEDTITVGTGEIRNSALEFDYITKFAVRRIPGSCTGVIKEDSSELSIRCQDDFFGRSVFVIKRPEQP